MADEDREDRAWGHEGEEPEIFGEEDEAGDPAAAFEALRAKLEDLSADLRREMVTIRKGVEAAFDQFEKIGTPIDYRGDLGNMIEQLQDVSERVHGVEKSPLLRQGPDHYAREFTRAGEAAVRAAAEQFQYESRDFRSAANKLMDRVYSSRERERQNWWLASIGVTGIVAGMLITLFLPRLFPQTIAPPVASIIMGDNAWQAGMALLSYFDVDAVRRVGAADSLVTVNKDAIADCKAAAAKTAKEQKCTIIVPALEKAP